MNSRSKILVCSFSAGSATCLAIVILSNFIQAETLQRLLKHGSTPKGQTIGTLVIIAVGLLSAYLSAFRVGSIPRDYRLKSLLMVLAVFAAGFFFTGMFFPVR